MKIIVAILILSIIVNIVTIIFYRRKFSKFQYQVRVARQPIPIEDIPLPKELPDNITCGGCVHANARAAEEIGYENKYYCDVFRSFTNQSRCIYFMDVLDTEEGKRWIEIFKETS